jgi:hypothetical protein
MEPGVMVGGRYRHYKNLEYRVVCVALLEATEEPCVVYEALYPNETSRFWIRPVKEFLSEVEVNGKKMKRFELMGE